jgi:hypothetical protein
MVAQKQRTLYFLVYQDHAGTAESFTWMTVPVCSRVGKKKVRRFDGNTDMLSKVAPDGTPVEPRSDFQF